MGPDRHRKDSCAGKLRYSTLDEAEIEIERAETYRGETLRAYLCERCENYHLTSWVVERLRS